VEHNGPPLEPARVLRPRRTDTLADLFREPGRDPADHGTVAPPCGSETVASPAPPYCSEDDTQDCRPSPSAPAPRDAPGVPCPGPPSPQP
jgi:hypothetical protein